MNTNTAFFRVALTVSAIWITVFAYLSFASYREAYQDTEFARDAVPDELTYECSAAVPVLSENSVSVREATIEERSTCYRRAADSYVRSIESANEFALEQTWKSFLWKGALPVIGLLTVVALWSALSTGAKHICLTYFNWLRFGSAKVDREKKSDEA